MARSVRASIEARSYRLRLPANGEAIWRILESGLSLAYVRPKSGGAGTWRARVMVSQAGQKPVKFQQTKLGLADDHQDADGEHVLSWPQAQLAAQRWAKGQTGKNPLTVAEACKRYVADLTARKGEKAGKGYKGQIRKHIEPTLGPKLVSKLTTAQLRSWHVGMVRGDDESEERRRQSRDTANRVLTTLRAALNLAFNDGLVADDRPWRRVKPFEGVSAARMVLLSPGDLQKLIDACPAGLRELVVAGALTGARLGELTGAEVRHLDLEAATLRVVGKTGAREIHLDASALTLCRKMASGKKTADRLFTTAEGGAWTASLHQRPFAAAVELAGIDPDTVFYSLRHTYISHALKVGVPTKAVADHCGTSLMMIGRTYAKFVPEDRKHYADLAAPKLRIGDDAGEGKVVSLKLIKATKAG